MAWFRRPRLQPRGEDGFTLVELMAALAVLLVGVLGVATTLNGTRDVVGTSEARETAVHRAERELERLRALPYDQLALSGLPGPSTDPNDPAFYVRGAQYQWDPDNAANVADLVTGGSVAPATPWNDGRSRGTLHVFITRYDDPSPIVSPREARRVIVAVTIDGRWHRRPAVLSTVVHQPPSTTP